MASLSLGRINVPILVRSLEGEEFRSCRSVEIVEIVGWVERSETQHPRSVGFRYRSTQPTLMRIDRPDLI
jgi:hypothetical protein